MRFLKDASRLPSGPAHPSPIVGQSTPVISVEGAWADVRNRLRAGTELKGWSRERPDTGLRFKVLESGADALTILTAPTAEKPKPTPRRIAKGEFARVYASWAAYCQGKVSRGEMTALSQNKSYLFSILRWRELTAPGAS